MSKNQKAFVSLYWQHIIVALLSVGVFCFWFFLYPFIPVAREVAVLFLWNTDYLLQRLALPGGLAQYLGEGVCQFFVNYFNAALFYALLFVVAQLLSHKLLRQFFPAIKKPLQFALSFVIPLILWVLAMLPHVSLTPTIALLLVMCAGSVIMSLSGKRMRLFVLLFAIPVMYWLAGPLAILLTLCCLRWIPLTATLFAACLVGSSYVVPYPLEQIARGIDYRWRGAKEMGTYEEKECDMLLRQNDWNKILRKFPSPVSPAVRCACILASYQTGRITYQELMSRIVVPVERFDSEPSVFCLGDMHLIVYFGSVESAFIVSDIAELLCWPNISQRAAFEAMEYIPNHNKSARALKLLTEISIITRQYPIARKYISILENTTFYRRWARKMLPLLDNPQLIDKHPFMRESQEKYDETEDIFFI